MLASSSALSHVKEFKMVVGRDGENYDAADMTIHLSIHTCKKELWPHM